MFASMSLARRLALGFISILVLLLAVAFTGAFSIHIFGKQVRHIVHFSNAKMDLANELESTAKNLSMGVRSVIVFGAYDSALIATEVKNNNESQESFKKAETKLTELVSGSSGTDEERKLIKEISEAAKIALPEIKDGLTLAAGNDTTALFLKMTKVRRTELALKAKIDEFMVLQRRQLDAENVTAESLQQRAFMIEVALVIASLAIGLFIGWRITLSITVPVARAVKVAERIASGDLTSFIESKSSDEIGRLLNAICDMQNKLKDLVGGIRNSAESIKIASNEVASANQNLSKRTETAASDLQETSRAMEILTGVITNSAESANNANQLATSAAKIAARGGTVVDEVVQTMGHINDSSKQISDIISVIDGIAFQTNILALNAAVEAARAGEQGRGFAVVAAEVRTLAGRSAQAAREIKALITNSVEKVALGSRLVDEAGKTMTDIVTSVQRVTDTIGEITSSASEQSDGINRINQAISSLDDMTQQNSALVEQGSSAAESLRDQAMQLADAVSIFKLNRASDFALTSNQKSQSPAEYLGATKNFIQSSTSLKKQLGSPKSAGGGIVNTNKSDWEEL